LVCFIKSSLDGHTDFIPDYQYLVLDRDIKKIFIMLFV